jgi:hypothetical protein
MVDKKKKPINDGKNHSLAGFVSGMKRRCKTCKIALDETSESSVDGYRCKYCRPAKEVEDL